MSNLFTAQELADFYQKVADGGEIDYTLMPKDCFGHPENGPHMGCSKDVWRIKPTKKTIDLSVLIDSQIDCEFWDDETDQSVYKLLSVDCSEYPYATVNESTRFCRPRMNHIHAWRGGECPLPEGFKVKIWLRDDDYDEKSRRLVSELIWSHNNTSSDIIAFEVLGLADGYVMPWEQDND